MLGMATLDWRGAPPPEALLHLLEKEGHVLSKRGPAEVVVLGTRTARPVPGAPAGGLPWLWVCQAQVPGQAVHSAVEAGAYDVVSLPEDGAASRLLARLSELTAPEPPSGDVGAFVGDSPATKSLLRALAQAAATSMPVLLTGDTGTGKELAARLIHGWSERRAGPFIPMNCAAIPNELMEGELFGYAKGAFSGAVHGYDGLLAAAGGGTVFLDEIDDTPHALQVKLLRVLEDRVVTRLGESSSRQVDFRILAATNRDLRKLIATGAFGADLYERLATLSIQLPPLRERTGDIPALVQHFIRRFHAEEHGAHQREPESVTKEALEALVAYPWPGNIRELRNVVFGVLASKRPGKDILLSHLPRRFLAEATTPVGAGVVDTARLARSVEEGSFNLRREVEQLERLAVGVALERSGGNATAAARLLGEVGRGTASDPGGTVRAMVRRLRLAPARRRA
jgi:transcriptional regulator with PAS, ATPase and Fis domain